MDGDEDEEDSEVVYLKRIDSILADIYCLNTDTSKSAVRRDHSQAHSLPFSPSSVPSVSSSSLVSSFTANPQKLPNHALLKKYIRHIDFDIIIRAVTKIQYLHI